MVCAVLPLFGACAVGAAVAPIISAVPDQVAHEDEPILDVPFTVSDPDTSVDQLRFSTSFNFDGRTSSRDNIVISGIGTNLWLSIYPLPDAAGLAQASITVSDANGLSATARFLVQVLPVNDPPRLSDIPDQTALRGQGAASVPLTVFDPDSTFAAIRLTAWSSRQSVVNNAGLRILQGTTVTNRTLLVSLSPTGSVGSTAVTIQADDNQGSNTVSFVLNVLPPNFGRSSNAIAGGVPSFQPIWGDFNGDGLLDLVDSASSIRTNRGGGLFSQRIQLPATQASGAAAADYDGDGDLDLLFYGATTTPRLLRNSSGAVTNFSLVSTNWASLQAYRGQLLWTDLDGDGDLDIIGGTNDIRWLRNEGQGTFTDIGTGIPSGTVFGVLAVGDFDNDGDPDVLAHTPTFVFPPIGSPRLYLNDGTGRLTDSQISLPQGVTRAAGWADVDNDGSLDLWLVQPQSSNSSTNSLVVLRQVAGRFVESFRLNDAAASTLQTTFAPPWADFDNDGDIDFVGRFWSRLGPAGNFTNYPSLYRNNSDGQFTTTGLSIAVDAGQLLPAVGDFDDDGSPDLLYREGVTSGTWLPMRNQARLLNMLPSPPWNLHSLIADNIVTFFWNDADDANQPSGLTYNVRVGTGPGKNDVVPSMSTTNGTRMITAPGNAGYNNWKTLDLPLERFNTETLYWTVQAVDNGFQGGPFAPEETFFINPPGNLPPSILGISDLTIPEDTAGNLTIYVTDDRTALSALRVLAISSNSNLMPAAGVRLSGFTNTAQGLRVNLSLTPLTNQVGETTITVTATDRSGLTTSRFFVVTVTPVNDPPTMNAPTTWLALAGVTTPPFSVTASDTESPVADLTLSATSLTPAVILDSNIILTRTTNGWTAVVRPSIAEPTTAQIRLALRDPQGAETQRMVEFRFQPQALDPFAREATPGRWPSPLIWADVNADRSPELLVGSGITIHAVEAGRLPVRARLIGPSAGGTLVDVGDIDNDGDVDVLGTTVVNEDGNLLAKLVIYRNLGNVEFQLVTNAIFGYGASRLADFDQDGRVDLVVVDSPTNLVIYRNTGAGFGPAWTTKLRPPASPVMNSFAGLDLVDLDGDGVVELIVVGGSLLGRPMCVVYRRSAADFEPITTLGEGSPVQAIADFDQDLLPDLLLDVQGLGHNEIWRNLSALDFGRSASLFSRAFSLAVAADFDSDGSADVLGYGTDVLGSGRGFGRLFLASTGMTFTAVEVPFASATVPAAAAADFDTDGVIDLAASLNTDFSSNPWQTEVVVYRGSALRTNHPPAMPANLHVTVLGSDEVVLSWDRATDLDQAGGLTYNIRMSTAPGLGDVVSPMSLTDGYRLVPRVGNAGWNTNFLLTALQPGRTYYWSVQAVDNSFAGGPFAPEAGFTMPDAALALHAADGGVLELELRAAPANDWRVEVSNDLKSWQDYSAPVVVLQTGTNGVGRAQIRVSAERQFFRARRGD